MGMFLMCACHGNVNNGILLMFPCVCTHGNEAIDARASMWRATKFMCKTLNLSYKERLIYLNLLPINYWLEYLDLIFNFKHKLRLISMNIDYYNIIQHCNSRTRLGMSGLTLYSQQCKTWLYRDSYRSVLYVEFWSRRMQLRQLDN
jgi:hypothetical protein